MAKIFNRAAMLTTEESLMAAIKKVPDDKLLESFGFKTGIGNETLFLANDAGLVIIGDPLSHEGIKLAQIDVHDFIMAMGQKHLTLSTPGIACEKGKELAIKLIAEESKELLAAIERNDLVEIADGIADLIYVCLWAANAYGLNMGMIWDEVQKTNMAKSTGPKSPEGKQLKPEGWVPPQILEILKLQGYQGEGPIQPNIIPSMESLKSVIDNHQKDDAPEAI